MTNLLLRIFVQNYKKREEPGVRAAIGSLSGFVGIGCNLLLFACKALIGTLSGSVRAEHHPESLFCIVDRSWQPPVICGHSQHTD